MDGQETVKKDQNFPVRLHYMLSEMEKDGLQHIVSWQPHGRCFVVHDQEEFVKSVLPMWFRQTKFPSFQRQLNIYGFTRIAAGPDKGAYYHELFLRGKQFLAQRIDRVKGGHRKQHGSKSEPNFYRIRPLPPSDHDSARQRQQASSPPSPLVAAAAAAAAAGTLKPVAAVAPSLGRALQELQGSALQNLLLQQRASSGLLLGGVLQSSSGLVEALLARQQLQQAMLLHPGLSLSSNDAPYSITSSSLEDSLRNKTTDTEPNAAPTDASSSSSSESSSKLPSGLEALCAATDSTLAIRALEAAAQQRLQQQQATELLLSRLLDGNGRRPSQME
jgi:hypothetical protein